MYMYLYSHQSNSSYPSNTGDRFTARLPKPVNLPWGQYECAISQLIVYRSEAVESVYVLNTNVIAPSQAYGEMCSTALVFTLPYSSKTNAIHNVDIQHLQYFPISRDCITDINCEIKELHTPKGSIDTFVQFQKVWITLHIRERV